jgi:hypothetical protein
LLQAAELAAELTRPPRRQSMAVATLSCFNTELVIYHFIADKDREGDGRIPYDELAAAAEAAILAS